METISNDTCTKCQSCGEWTNYADDPHHKARMRALVARNASLDEVALHAARNLMPLMKGSIKELCQLQAKIQVGVREAIGATPTANERINTLTVENECLGASCKACGEQLTAANERIRELEASLKSETQRADINSNLRDRWHSYVLKLYAMVGSPAHGELDTHLGVERITHRAEKAEKDLAAERAVSDKLLEALKKLSLRAETANDNSSYCAFYEDSEEFAQAKEFASLTIAEVEAMRKEQE